MTAPEYVAVLDEARREGGDWRPLEAACYLSLHPADPLKKQIVHESLVAIYHKFCEGVPSVLLGPQIAGIVHMKRRHVLQSERRPYKRLVPVGDEEYRLDSSAPAEDEPPNVVVSLEEFKERVEMVRAALERLKIDNPRQYELIWADMNDVTAARHLQQVFGTPLKPEAVRALRRRAHLATAKYLADTRKETSP